MSDTEPLPSKDLTDPQVRAAVIAAAMARHSQKVSLLEVYRAAGEPGLTYEEAADVLGWTNTRKCWWRRCGNLREEGLIERHGTPQVRRGTQGPECAVYVISPAGLAALAALDS